MNFDEFKTLRIGFIGSGKVGFSLGKFFKDKGLKLSGFYSRSTESAKEAAAFTNAKCFENLIDIVDNSDVLYLTVPDDQISLVFQSIKDLNIAGKFICHTSGALSSKEAFESIRDYNAFGFSIHPLYPFSDKYNSYKGLMDAFFCLEGDENYINLFKELFESLNLNRFIIDAKDKKKYHAACSISSNLYCGLVKISQELLMEAGFDHATAIKALSPLITSNAMNIIDKGPSEALTGPIERNDISTIKKHLECLSFNKLDIYKKLSLKLTDISVNRHPDRNYDEMIELLKN